MCMRSKPTDALVPAVEELGEGRGGALLLDHGGALLVGGELAQHARGHALDVLDLVVEQLHEDGDDGEAPDDGPVVGLPGEDVERAHGALHDLLHPDAVGVAAGGLRAAPAAPALGVLERPDEEVHQPGEVG